jgi:polar amino acid transport system substrate-binding protein
MTRTAPTVCSLLVGALIVAGCGSSATDTNPPATGPAALVPASIRGAGILKFGINTGYPPWDEFTNGQYAGADVALGNEVAHRLGLRAQWSQISFGTLITSLEANRIDLILSGMSDTKTREKVINFVDYYSTPWGFLLLKGNPEHISTLASLCGLTASAESGTVGVTFLQQQSQKCTSGGRPAVNVTTYDNVPEIQTAIRSGRTDVDLENYDALQYVATTVGGGSVFQAIPLSSLPSSPYGIGVDKSDTGLLKAVQQTLQAMIQDGTYQQILRRYGIDAGYETEATVNGAPS